MERVGTLINKLKEQHLQNEDVYKLLITAQMLVAELQIKDVSANTKKVAVTMPFTSLNLSKIDLNDLNEPTDLNEAPMKIQETKAIGVKTSIKKDDNLTGWLFDPSMVSIPTLAHHEIKAEQEEEVKTEKELFELKDMVFVEEGTTINEQLKEETKEVASTIILSPVKDLKKAIGINDRYLFINDLFRGDEDMYERSIKTINGFSIFAEAEYWIQRELKVKLGWIDNQQTVVIFDQLVKRRFS